MTTDMHTLLMELLNETDLNQLKQAAEEFVSSSEGNVREHGNVSSFESLAESEVKISSEIINRVSQMGVVTKDEKVPLIFNMARTGYLMDLSIQAAKCKLTPPNVPYPNIRVVTDAVFHSVNT